MDPKSLKKLVKEQFQKALKEDYQDQYKIRGKLITNITSRTQHDIISDIRAISGITVVSSEEIPELKRDSSNFTTILNIKIDGYPFIKQGGFSRDKIGEILNLVRKVPDVISFKYNPDRIEAI